MKNLTIEKTLFVAILGLLPLCGCVNETPVPPPQEILVSPQDMIELRDKAKKGDKSAQRNISERYATGNTLVKDEVLAEQWAMRASPTMSTTTGGNALAVLQGRLEDDATAAKTTAPAAGTAKPSAPVAVSQKSVPVTRPEKRTENPNTARVASAQTKPQTATPVSAQRISEEDFHWTIRAASQGNRSALKKLQPGTPMRAKLESYARTAEGRKNPFVAEVMKKLK